MTGRVATDKTPEQIAEGLTTAMGHVLRLVACMGYVEWNIYPASFKRLAALGLVVKDDEGWVRMTDLGLSVAAVLAKRGAK